MVAINRKPGWDKQAVNRIANEHYGDLKSMFEAHGWVKGDKTFGQIAPTWVAQTYGSVGAFVQAHENGLEMNALLNPFAAIESDPPDVWLTSYYGYDPENWGLLAFGSAADRDRFIERSQPGALIVVYGTKSLRNDDAGMVLGVQQVSHHSGPSEQFMSPEAWAEKQSIPRNRNRWLYAVQCTRAWAIVPEQRPAIEDFANETWNSDEGRVIARYCKQMTAKEARKILDLEMYECSVFGGRQIETISFGSGEESMTPSRPGPVSQNGFQVSESEGPKYLYMLELTGNGIEAFIKGKLNGRKIVKIGFSKSPDLRCKSFNKALPGQKFKWQVDRSTSRDGLNAYPTSHHAKAGEQEMVRYLHQHHTSLGGEFFLATTSLLEKAWKKGKKVAKDYKA